jgi:hypothetical protein
MMRPSVRAYTFCGVTIASELALPPLGRGALADAVCSIAAAALDVAEPPVEWFKTWRPPGGRVWFAVGRRRGGYLLRFTDMADFAISSDGRRVVVDPADGLPAETLRHLLIDMVLPLALSRRGRFSLHASAVHLPGIGAVGFVGQTGRGKSTLAAALAAGGARLLTDDCLAIDFVHGEPVAQPGYPGLRLWPSRAAKSLLTTSSSTRVAHYSGKRRLHRRAVPYHGRPSPLRALFVLAPPGSAGDALRIRRCRPAASLMALLRFAHMLDPANRKDMAHIFANLAALATAVPVMRLRVRHGHRRLPQAADLIRAHAAAMLTS